MKLRKNGKINGLKKMFLSLKIKPMGKRIIMCLRCLHIHQGNCMLGIWEIMRLVMRLLDIRKWKGLMCCIRLDGIVLGYLRKMRRLIMGLILENGLKRTLTTWEDSWNLWVFLMIGIENLALTLQSITNGIKNSLLKCIKKDWFIRKNLL